MAVPITAKSLSFEQEQDANSALTELDKALRSGQIGVQCEAVVKFPRLFEKYPFPILINSAMLKIADLFRNGNNFIRLCILRVAQQSEKHLDKIFTVEQFIRRIFGVIHSNDPVARAITLRTLGSVANIISEKKSVHHSIIQCLDSHNAVEVEAAIFAAQKFSEKSKMFAATVCSKIGAMIASLATPSDRKLKLIPILQYMHHDTDTASKAMDLCRTILSSYPASAFVTLTLHTMSQLTTQSLLSLQDQVSRLLSYLTSDPRRKVRAVCLDDLRMLAQRAAYLWSVANLEAIARFSLDCTSTMLQVKAVKVLNDVCGNPAMTGLHLSHDTGLLDVCREFCYHNDMSLATQAVQLLTHLAKFNSSPSGLTQEAVGAIQTHAVILVSEVGHHNLMHLKVILKCGVTVCQGHPDVSEKIVETLTGLLAMATESHQLALCECLAAIGSSYPAALEPVTPTILASLMAAISDTDSNVHQVQVHMCTLLFQAGCQRAMSGPIHGTVMACISRAGNWEAYKVARQAMRYCQYQVAHDILKSLNVKVVTEQIHFWLLGLQHACAAEHRLAELTGDGPGLVAGLGEAVQMFVKSHVALKAASSPSLPLEFPWGYVQLRLRTLGAHHLLLVACTSFRTKPPPAIAMAVASSSGQEGTRWAQVVSQLEKCLKEYKEASALASTIYRSAFDADADSLTNINVIQQGCDCMKSVISTIISTIHTGQSNLGERQFLTSTKDQPGSLGSHGLGSTMSVMQDISAAMDKLLPETNSSAIISYKLLDILWKSASSLCKACPSYPRYFFQTLQTTVVKLAVSPQQSPNQDPIMLRGDTHLALRVEGVVQRGERPALYRQVSQVTIGVSTSLASRTSAANPNIKSNEVTTIQLSQTVTPHNDYFSTSFVLPFHILGIHTVKVEASVVDENGVSWCTGPRTSLMVKSYDDNQRREQQMRRAQPSTSLAHHGTKKEVA